MKKIVALFLVIVMCLCVCVSCTTLDGDDDKGANINMFITSFPTSLDPSAMQTNADASLILSLLYEPLTSIDEDGNVVGALADNWYSYYDNRDEEYNMYFELNTTYWSDGIQVLAQDIVYAWKRILSPDSESPYCSLLYPIKNAKSVKAGILTDNDLGLYAEGDTLLRVIFEPIYDENGNKVSYNTDLFAETVSCIALSPLRENIIVKAMKDNPVGSDGYDRNQDWDKNAAIMVANGPFKLQGYEEGVKLVLERNSHYRREDDDYLDESVIPYRLTCIFQETTITGEVENKIDGYTYQYNKFLDGKCFFIGDFSKTTYAEAEKTGELETANLLSTYTYFFNTKNELLSNEKVRQALSLAIDRNKVVEIMGTGEIASTGFVPSGVFGESSKTDFRSEGGNVYQTTADVTKAKSLLSDAGVSSGTIKISYIIPWTNSLYSSTEKFSSLKNSVETYNPYKLVAEYVAEAWTELGFTVKLNGVYSEDYNTLLSSGNWDVIGIDYVVNSVDALAYLAPFAKSCSGNIVPVSLESSEFTAHYTGIDNEEYNTLIESAIYETDRAKRNEILHKAETKLAELCPATSLFQYTRSYLASDELSGIETDNYYGFYDFTSLRLDDYLDINSKETEESLAAETAVK